MWIQPSCDRTCMGSLQVILRKSDFMSKRYSSSSLVYNTSLLMLCSTKNLIRGNLIYYYMLNVFMCAFVNRRLGYIVDLEERRGKDEQRVDEGLHLWIYKVKNLFENLMNN